MSEVLSKLDEKTQVLKSLILRLHQGENYDQVKAEFIASFKYVSGQEIVRMEQALIDEGVGVEEVMALCDIHASLFEDNLQGIHSDQVADHPYALFTRENRLIEAMLENPNLEELYPVIDSHYASKENLIFPLLEQAGITTIPQVMWGVDNTIRQELKSASGSTQDQQAVLMKVRDMITKEEKVLFQVLDEHLTTQDWDRLKQALLQGKEHYESEVQPDPQQLHNGEVHLPSGVMSVLELEKLLNVLPLDITFVDKSDRVAYVSQGAHRIFDRPLSVLGREVRLCHPPQSVHIVEAILEDFKAKRKTSEVFWIHFRGMYVYIQYYAIYDQSGDYLGVIEVTQDIQPLQELTGEKRLMEETHV